jgi:uncharacterized membrane protein (DUF485 family)
MSKVGGLEKPKVISEERIGLAIILTAVEAIMFFSFIFISAFSPATLGSRIGGSSVNLAFVYAMIILIVSVLLIGLYVQIENKKQHLI